MQLRRVKVATLEVGHVICDSETEVTSKIRKIVPLPNGFQFTLEFLDGPMAGWEKVDYWLNTKPGVDSAMRVIGGEHQ